MSPTNILRQVNAGGSRPSGRKRNAPRPERREVLIRAGSIVLRARVHATPTGNRIWQALPIYSTAETWGKALHFETPVETGRERGAKSFIAPGEIAYWSEEDRVLIGFGATPISKPNEIRLPSPCNIWAQALDDVSALAVVRPGERVSLLQAES